MDNSGNNNQTRFLIAAILSMVILFGWSYFFAPPKPAGDANANVAANTNTAQTQTPQPAPTVAPQAPSETLATTPDTTPNRTITVKSSLYEVKLDSKGAVATSWILFKNKSPKGDFPVFADGSNSSEEKPLQLISDEALKRTPREIPFRLSTGDAILDATINDRNYLISAPEEAINLADGEEKSVEFTLTDATGLEVKKTFLFRADRYVSDLAISVKRAGVTVPNTKLLIGASIGDHAINHHNFYHIESEAVAGIDGDIKRHQGNYAFTYDANNQSTLVDNGNVDWAGGGAAYFAMASIVHRSMTCKPNPILTASFNGSSVMRKRAKRGILLRFICRSWLTVQ
jgi:YidC/Oxa1 family membrane protein insertase